MLISFHRRFYSEILTTFTLLHPKFSQHKRISEMRFLLNFRDNLFPIDVFLIPEQTLLILHMRPLLL